MGSIDRREVRPVEHRCSKLRIASPLPSVARQRYGGRNGRLDPNPLSDRLLIPILLFGWAAPAKTRQLPARFQSRFDRSSSFGSCRMIDIGIFLRDRWCAEARLPSLTMYSQS